MSSLLTITVLVHHIINLSLTMTFLSMAFSSTSGFVSYTTNPDYMKTEGFKQFCQHWNTHSARVTWNDANTPYPSVGVVYNKVRNLGASELLMEDPPPKDFVGANCVAACCKLKHLSLAPLCHTQMDHCMRKWDKCDNKGAGDKVVDTCHQLIGSVSIRIYNSMVDVHELVSTVLALVLTTN